MTCLGWYNRTTCATRPQVDMTPNTASTPTAPGAKGAGSCPDITWFWLAAAAILGTAAIKKT